MISRINGFDVVTTKVEYANSIAISIVISCGSRSENDFESGMAHFLEHMAFKGTQSRSAKKIAEIFDSIGGNFNAYTGKEFTVFYCRVLKDYFQDAMEIMADILQNPLFGAADIQNERNTISQEIAEYLDDPASIAYDNMMLTAFPNQAIGRSILGTDESISKFKTKDFIDFRQKHYGKIVISVSGNVDHTEVCALASTLFENKYYESVGNPKSQYVGGYSYLDHDSEQVNYFISFESTNCKDIQMYYIHSILATILGGGMSSRLFQNIREKYGIVYSIGAFLQSYTDVGITTISASTTSENFIQLQDLITTELDNIQKDISSSELIRAKTQIKSSILIADESIGNKSDENGKILSIYGRLIDKNEIIKTVDGIELSMIEAAAKIFSTKSTIAIVGKDVCIPQ